MSIRWCRFVAVLLGPVSLIAAENPRNIDTRPEITTVKTLSQNWTDKESNDFYNAPQGSRLLPFEWFLHLEQPDSTESFRTADNLRSLGYIPRLKDDENPHALPVGFVRDASYEDDTPGLGMTCAACHTSQINHNGTAFIVDGGPAMGDFETLMKNLSLALQQTGDDEGKFNRFADALQVDVSSEAGAVLRSNVRAVARQRAGYNERNLPARGGHSFGPGRVDAFGAIFNEVAVTFLDIQTNWHPANAPVSYPCLWDAPLHKNVQWNGAAENRTSPLGQVLFGTPEVGALGRNSGEVLGVFGHMNVNSVELPIPLRYASTVNKKNLIAIEDSLKSLWSPKWPQAEFGALDQSMVARGEQVYQKAKCVDCHSIIDREKQDRKVGEKIANVDTDQTLLINFGRQANTGRLAGRRKTLTGKERFEQIAPVGVILKHVVERTILAPDLDPIAIQTTLAGILTINQNESINELNPGFQMTAVIQTSERMLVGKFDSLIKEGPDLKVKGGLFHVMDKARDFVAQGVGDKVVDLRSMESVQSAASQLEGVVSVDTTESITGPDAAAEATINNAEKVIGYKARPLNGIWATAPYLHNGSVPTLIELLKPAANRRKTFHVGSQEFDPANVGFKDDETKPVFDTTADGISNSNKGHEFGAELSDRERRDLLEYLKSL